MKVEFYQKEKSITENNINKDQEISSRYTYLRALVGALFLFFVYINFINTTLVYFIGLSLCVIVFMVLVFFHNKIKKRIDKNHYRGLVIQRYIDRIEGHWTSFDKGDEFKQEECFMDKDLDIIGKHSLFQMINVAKTRLGKLALVKCLVFPDLNQDTVCERQVAIKELASNKLLSLKFMSELEPTNKKDDIQMLENLLDKMQMEIKMSKWVWGIRILSILFFVLCVFGVFKEAGWSLVTLMILVNNVLSFVLSMRYHTLFEPVQDLSLSLNAYLEIFELLSNTPYQSKYLMEQLSPIRMKSTLNGIRQISRISSMVGQRKNIIAYLFLNGIGLYDAYLVECLSKWKKENEHLVLSWFESLGIYESLQSLAILEQTYEQVVYPTMSNDLTIEVADLKHPLMNQQLAIGNDFTLKQQANIITGSNMSGKTTFLRTLGVNIVLSLAGGSVCATKATLPLVRVLTSMRIEDELSSGTSTFYAELKRIKYMIDQSQTKQPVLCLVDEIFKGTNSADRIVGAKAAIERLVQPNVILFVSTHDFELCDLEKTLSIQNYHFSEYYENQQIHFSYKIQSGRCHTTNARFLLEMVGIIEKPQ